mmetsp:Transcript_8152/g.14511  ORF Transcript_8152/g.14511 Transcript_8152/m.14511 type:complete len:648 (-) Transcript_8152:136-2079(-)
MHLPQDQTQGTGLGGPVPRAPEDVLAAPAQLCPQRLEEVLVHVQVHARLVTVGVVVAERTVDAALKIIAQLLQLGKDRLQDPHRLVHIGLQGGIGADIPMARAVRSVVVPSRLISPVVVHAGAPPLQGRDLVPEHVVLALVEGELLQECLQVLEGRLQRPAPPGDGLLPLDVAELGGLNVALQQLQVTANCPLVDTRRGAVQQFAFEFLHFPLQWGGGQLHRAGLLVLPHTVDGDEDLVEEGRADAWQVRGKELVHQPEDLAGDPVVALVLADDGIVRCVVVHGLAPLVAVKDIAHHGACTTERLSGRLSARQEDTAGVPVRSARCGHGQKLLPVLMRGGQQLHEALVALLQDVRLGVQRPDPGLQRVAHFALPGLRLFHTRLQLGHLCLPSTEPGGCFGQFAVVAVFGGQQTVQLALVGLQLLLLGLPQLGLLRLGPCHRQLMGQLRLLFRELLRLRLVLLRLLPLGPQIRFQALNAGRQLADRRLLLLDQGGPGLQLLLRPGLAGRLLVQPLLPLFDEGVQHGGQPSVFLKLGLQVLLFGFDNLLRVQEILCQGFDAGTGGPPLVPQLLLALMRTGQLGPQPVQLLLAPLQYLLVLPLGVQVLHLALPLDELELVLLALRVLPGLLPQGVEAVQLLLVIGGSDAL